jgi:hypothetical protein
VRQPYVLAKSGADATTMFGPDPIPLSEQATRLEFAAGLSAKILPSLSVYAQAGYQFASERHRRRQARRRQGLESVFDAIHRRVLAVLGLVWGFPCQE